MCQSYIQTGKIVAVHGLKGEVRIAAWSNAPEDLLRYKCFYVGENLWQKIDVISGRIHKNVMIAKLKGYHTIEQAKELIGTVLYIKRDDVPRKKDEYFIQDLIGMQVFDVDTPNIYYGTVTKITKNGTRDVFHIKDQNNRYLMFPSIPEVVHNIDLHRRKIHIRPLKGLFDDEN